MDFGGNALTRSKSTTHVTLFCVGASPSKYIDICVHENVWSYSYNSLTVKRHEHSGRE